MKRLLCVLMLLVLGLLFASCGKNDTKNNDVPQYTVLCIPANSAEYYENATVIPESALENVIIQYCDVGSVCTLFGFGDKRTDQPSEIRKVTVDGVVYEEQAGCFSNEWAGSENERALKYAYFAHSTFMPKADTVYNMSTDRLAFLSIMNNDYSFDTDLGKEAIAQKADALLCELYGEKYLKEYRRTVSADVPQPNQKYYTVVYRRYIGEYPCDDYVLFRYTPKGMVTDINARTLDLFEDYSFPEEKLDLAKDALYSAVYPDPATRPADEEVKLVMDGLTGTCYMEIYVHKQNDGKYLKWQLLLPLT